MLKSNRPERICHHSEPRAAALPPRASTGHLCLPGGLPGPGEEQGAQSTGLPQAPTPPVCWDHLFPPGLRPRSSHPGAVSWDCHAPSPPSRPCGPPLPVTQVHLSPGLCCAKVTPRTHGSSCELSGDTPAEWVQTRIRALDSKVGDQEGPGGRTQVPHAVLAVARCKFWKGSQPPLGHPTIPPHQAGFSPARTFPFTCAGRAGSLATGSGEAGFWASEYKKTPWDREEVSSPGHWCARSCIHHHILKATPPPSVDGAPPGWPENHWAVFPRARTLGDQPGRGGRWDGRSS